MSQPRTFPSMPPDKAKRVRKLQVEYAKRTSEALALYTPLEHAEEFHASDVPERLLRGCLAGEQEIYDPVAKDWRRVDSIDSSWHVLAFDGEKLIEANADAPFIKGATDIYEVSIAGKRFRSTIQHRVLTSVGWTSVYEAWAYGLPLTFFPDPLSSSLEPCQLTHAEDGRHLSRRPEDFQGGYQQDRHFCDEQLLPGEVVGQEFLQRIDSLRFLRRDKYYDFNVPVHHNYWCHAIHHNSNRSGKTLTASVEAARATTGQDPYNKYPQENGRCVIVGLDGRHNGQVLYRKLFRPGSYKVIRDERTKMWRSFRPWDEVDLVRSREAIDAPPLIPRRLVKSESWESKKESVPKLITLINGWEVLFISSLSKPPQGIDIDLLWFDEEIVDEEWYSEGSARLLDRNGKFMWSATAQKGGYQLYELCQTAEKQFLDGMDPPRIKEYVMHLNTNRHITDEMKNLFFEKLTPEQRKVRIEGEFEFTALRVFPEYSWRTHGHEWFEIPRNWTRYMIVDPGRQVCAALFVAIPAPSHELAGHVFIYDELYIRNCDVTKFAKAVREKAHGQQFRDFIIDHQGGRVRYMDEGGSQEWQLSEALKKVKVRSQISKYGFTWGSPDVPAGLEKARSLLVEKLPNGKPVLQVFTDKCPSFQWEIDRYHYRKEKSLVTDKPEQRNSHLMDCFDDQTEVLTESGWRLFPAVTMQDNLATVNLDTDRIEYQKPTELIDKEGPDEMIRFGGHKMNALVTPGHRMVVYPRQGNAGYDNDNPVIKEAQNLAVTDRIKLWGTWTGEQKDVVLIPRCATSHADSRRRRILQEKEIDPLVWAEFLGWWIAEGHRTKTVRIPGSGYCVQVSQLAGPKRELLRFVLGKTPWKWHENKLGFYTSSKQLWTYLEPLGDTYTKRVPRWIKSATPEVIHRFLTGAVLGDGWVQHGRQSYVTVSRELADDMQELFIKLGRTASVRVRPAAAGYSIRGRQGTNCVDQFWVSEWIQPHGGLRDSKQKPNFYAAPYNGRVYCAGVPNGTLIVRREGKPLVAGNCLRYTAMYQPRWHPPPKKVNKGVYNLVQQKKKKERQRNGPPGITLGPVSVHK